MSSVCDNNICTGCGVCSVCCPKKCIEMIEDSEGFLIPDIDDSKCVHCGLCHRSCHLLNEITGGIGEYCTAWHKDKNVLLKSSSGGIFTALATYVLNEGGVVIGAEINQKTRILKHVAIRSVEELDRIRLSKYYQSDTKEIFGQVKELLRNEKQVLFCGTACQVAALKVFLAEPYEYLITVDVLCHGVTNKKMIDSYVHCKEKKYKKKIKSIFFRVKSGKTGWMRGGGTRMKLEFEDGSFVITDKETDTFFTAFNNNLILREACYNCKYCGEERVSDFTLADHWGIEENEVSNEQKWYGVSLILANTQKAQNFLNKINDEIEISPTNRKAAIESNRALVRPNSRPDNRSDIFPIISKIGFDNAIYSTLKNYYRKAKVRGIIYKIIGEQNYIKIMTKIRNR